MKEISNDASGINYSLMDPFKRQGQQLALATSSNLKNTDPEFSVLESSRGESAFAIETPFGYLTQVVEGLGSKSKVADAMYSLTDNVFDRNVGICGCAMINNDLITLGGHILSSGMYFAVGSAGWFRNEKRATAILEGWAEGNNLSGCVWGGGETPTLRDIIYPDAYDLAGSAMGIIQRKEDLILQSGIKIGDAIILFPSSGVHANGITPLRDLANMLPEGWLIKLPNGKTFGETVLEPTTIYVKLIQEIQKIAKIHYAVNITGHGWRKLMRADLKAAYVIDRLPKQLPIFDFIGKYIKDRKALYGAYNMGAGFAVYVSQEDVEKVMQAAASVDMHAIHAGNIEASEEKKVVILPEGIEFSGHELEIR